MERVWREVGIAGPRRISTCLTRYLGFPERMGSRRIVLKVNALRITQRPDVPLYVFGINGRLVQQFSTVRIAERDGAGELAGYQRARVSTHIRDIRNYLQ